MSESPSGKGDRVRPFDRQKWDEHPIWEAMKEWSKEEKEDEDE